MSKKGGSGGSGPSDTTTSDSHTAQEVPGGSGAQNAAAQSAAQQPMNNMFGAGADPAMMNQFMTFASRFMQQGGIVSAIPDVTMTESLNDFLSSVTSSLSSTDSLFANLKPYLEEFKYIGFPLEKMRAFIIYKLDQYNAAERRSNLVKLVACALMRGNNLTNMVKRMNPINAQFIETMKMTLNIKMSPRGDANAITLSRIAVCFPELAYFVAEHCEIKGPVVSVDAEYPYGMRFGCFSSMIPLEGISGDNKYHTIKKAFLYYSGMLSIVLDRKHPVLSWKVLDQQSVYVDAGVTQSKVSDQRRKEILSLNRKIILNGELTPVIITYARKYDEMMATKSQ